MTEESTLHHFLPQVAELYGIEAALVYSYICFRSRNQPNGFVELTLDDLCAQYPYMGRYQVWAALQRLLHQTKKLPNLVVRKQVVNAYFYRPIAQPHADEIEHRFDIGLAAQIGIVPAIVFQSLSHWIRKNWETKMEAACDILDPEKFDFDGPAMQDYAYIHTRQSAAHWTTIPDWLKRRPYISYRSVRRALKLLREEGFILYDRVKKQKTMFRLAPREMKKLESILLSSRRLKNTASKSKRIVAKIKCTASKSKRIASKPKCVSPLNAGTPDTSECLSRQFIDSRASRSLESKVQRDNDGFAQSSLADARSSAARSASSDLASPSEMSALRKLNQPDFPEFKKRIKRDCFGNPVKRAYHRTLSQDHPDFEEWYDGLSKEERQRYLASR